MWNRNANILIKKKKNCLLTSWCILPRKSVPCGIWLWIKNQTGRLGKQRTLDHLGDLLFKKWSYSLFFFDPRTFSLSRRYRPFKITTLYLWDESTKQCQMNSFTLFLKKKRKIHPESSSLYTSDTGWLASEPARPCICLLDWRPAWCMIFEQIPRWRF